MSFFVDYLKHTTDLLKEAFTLRKYKAMPTALAILCGIVMLPFFVATLPLIAVLYVGGFLFKIISAIIQHLHGVVRSAGSEVKHATQFIIYFISWGFIFLQYMLAATLLLTLTVAYALLALVTYVWTFGGFRFHFFAEEQNGGISVPVHGTYRLLRPLLLVLGTAVLLLLIPLVKTLIEILPMYIGDITLETVWNTFKHEALRMTRYYYLFALLYSAILLCPYPKASAQAPAQAPAAAPAWRVGGEVIEDLSEAPLASPSDPAEE